MTLLSKDKLTLNKALEMCVALETATIDAAELQYRNRDPAPVNKFKITPKPIKTQRQKSEVFSLWKRGSEILLSPKGRMLKLWWKRTHRMSMSIYIEED